MIFEIDDIVLSDENTHFCVFVNKLKDIRILKNHHQLLKNFRRKQIFHNTWGCKSTVFLVALIILSKQYSFGQQAYVDSLIEIVNTSTNLQEQIKAQVKIQQEYSNLDLIKCEKEIPHTIEWLSKNTDTNTKFQGGLALGQSYYLLGKHKEASEHLNDILPYAGIVEDKSDICYVHTILAFINEDVNTDSSLYHMNQAVDLAKSLDDPGLLGATYNNLGNIYLHRGLKEEAKKYYLDALEPLRSGGSKAHLATALLNISILTKDDSIAEEYMVQAKNLFNELGYAQRVAQINVTQGFKHFTKKEFGKAKKYYSKYVTQCADADKTVTYYSCLIPLGLCYYDVGQIDSATLVLKEAEAYYQNENFLSLAEAMAYHEGMMKVHAAADNYEQAYYHSWRRTHIFDSLEYSKNATYTAEFDVLYNTEKKEKQLIAQQLQIEKEKNKRSQTLLFSLATLAFITLLGGWYFFNLRRRKQETQHQLNLQAVEAATLKDLNQMKSRWFENISHDIRTPLTLISAPIKDLLKSTKSAPAQNLLKIADRNSQHLLQLTNEMLELARLENNVIPLRLSNKKTFDEINKIIHAFDSFAAEKYVSIHAQVSIKPEAWYELDYDKYEKIFNNLFKNAILYSPLNSSVHVEVSIDQNVLTTKIVDEGPGIPEEEIPLLFDKYFRANHQQSAQVKGSGLGLSIVQELLTIVGGHIDVTSKLHHGSTFSFNMPIVQAEPSADITDFEVEIVEHLEAPVLLPGHQRKHLLVVEDNPEMSNYLTTVLSSEYETQAALNGKIALQLLANHQFDLIISDIMMPAMDGFTLKQHVNTLTQHDKTPFIFLSAKSLDADKLKGLRMGIDDYITKPFVTEELKIRIRNILARKFVREELLEEEIVEDNKKTALEENTIVDQARKLVLANLSDVSFGVEQLATDLHYSRRQLSRILKKQTGLTSVQFILEIRLLQARALLLDGHVYSVKEVQHEIGIQSQSYFSRKYTERFGCTPGSHVN